MSSNPGKISPASLSVMTQASSHSSRSAAPKKKAKRGRPKKKAWSLRSKFLRRHSPKYLRRTEVKNLIAADTFATRIGQPLVAFVSIRWIHTQEGEANIQRRWTSLLNALRIWASRNGITWHAIGVHENPERLTPAFNSHILANIPVHLHGVWAEWLRKQLGGEPEAVDVRRRASTNWLKDNTLRYVLKGADPQTAHRYGIRYSPQGIVSFRRCTITRNINARAREAWKLSGTIKMDAGRGPAKSAADTVCQGQERPIGAIHST